MWILNVTAWLYSVLHVSTHYHVNMIGSMCPNDQNILICSFFFKTDLNLAVGEGCKIRRCCRAAMTNPVQEHDNANKCEFMLHTRDIHRPSPWMSSQGVGVAAGFRSSALMTGLCLCGKVVT